MIYEMLSGVIIILTIKYGGQTKEQMFFNHPSNLYKYVKFNYNKY